MQTNDEFKGKVAGAKGQEYVEPSSFVPKAERHVKARLWLLGGEV